MQHRIGTQALTAPATSAMGDKAWMGFVVFVGLAARLMHIDHQSLWLDEALTLQRIHLDPLGLIVDSFANRHMPSYFLLLQLISQFVAGDGWLRIPSALFGALSAGMVYAIAQRISGRGAACVAGLLMALSPTQVQYGQEARSYTLLILLIAIALWGLVRLAEQPQRAARGWRDPGFERIGWAACVFGTIGALIVLGDAEPWLIVCNLSLYLIWRSLRDERAAALAFRRNWWISQGLVLAVCAPFYAAILAAGDGQMLQKFDWVPQLSWHGLWVTTSSVYLMRIAAVVRYGLLPTTMPWLGALVLLLGALGLYRMRTRLEGRILLLAFLVLPLLLLAISLFKSMLVPRYILWSAAPFFVLAGLGAASLPKRCQPMIAMALGLLCVVNLAPVYRTETKPRWDMAAATLAAKVRPGDTIYTADPNAPTMLAALQPKGAAPISGTAMVTPSLDLALERWKQGSRVWAVNGRSAMGQREDLDVFKNRIAALGSPAMQIPQGKEITILMFPAPGERLN